MSKPSDNPKHEISKLQIDIFKSDKQYANENKGALQIYVETYNSFQPDNPIDINDILKQ